MAKVINDSFMEICLLLGTLRAQLADNPHLPGHSAHQHLTELHTRLESEAVQLIEGWPDSIDNPLPMAMQAYSRDILRAVPQAENAAKVDDGSHLHFLRWAQAPDFELAAARGLRLGGRLDEVLKLARKEPEIDAVIFDDIARRGVLMERDRPAWAEMQRIWHQGEVDQLARLLEIHTELFPDEMREALYARADMNDAHGAEILFRAGARPAPDRPLVAPDAACLPGGFLDRAKSNHGLMAVLHGPSVHQLITSYRRHAVPF